MGEMKVKRGEWVKVMVILLTVVLFGVACQQQSEPTSTSGQAAQPAQPAQPAERVWSPDEVVLQCGDQTLTFGQLETEWKGWSPGSGDLADLSAVEKRKFFLRFYHSKLFAAEARARGLDQSQEFLARTAAERYRLLGPVYRRREIIEKINPTREELLQYIPPALDDVRVRIIVKSDFPAAQSIYERAVAGEDFAELARRESEGFLRDAGGLTKYLNTYDSEKLPSPVVQSFLDTPIGGVLEPFYQDIGFLVVKIESKRSADQLRDAELVRRRQEILTKLYQEKYQRRIDELRQEARITLHQDVLDQLKSGSGDPEATVLEINDIAFSGDTVLGLMGLGIHTGQPVEQRVESFIPTALVAQEALRLGLDQDPDFRVEWGLKEQKALARELVRVELEGQNEVPVTDEDIKYYMQAKPEEFMEPETRRLRVVVTRSEAGATDALGRLAAGEAFEAVATELSTHQETAVKGGDMGYLEAAAVPEVVRNAAFRLPPGRYTDPALRLAAPDGSPLWLIVQVVDVHEAAPTPLESAKTPKVEERIRTLKRTKQLKTLTKDLEKKYGYNICFENRDGKE